MTNYIELLLTKIEAKDSKHAIKLRNNLMNVNHEYFQIGNAFYEKYEKYLLANSLSLDYGVDCYLKMLHNMLEERIKFVQTGSYSSTSFAEVDKRVYANPGVMAYHMHGLVLAQFLWFDQYERIKFFIDNIQKHFQDGKKYLEIGGGHGLYINEAVRLLPKTTEFDLVDISESSLTLAKGILNTPRINYFLKNIFDFTNDDVYDFVTLGEVLEHVEEPLSLLQKIRDHLRENGICYLTTPINAPMIDHIYLFNDEHEIRNLFVQAGFEIIEEKIVISERISAEKAKKFKVPVMYAAFIRKI